MPDASTNQRGSDPDRAVWLIAIAAPRECDAVLGAFGYTKGQPDLWECVSVDARFDIVRTGVGKASSAGGVARVLDPSRHLGVISAGIAGALPGSGCRIGDVVCARASVFGDEGVLTPSGFEPTADMGFAAFDNGTDSIEHHQRVIDWLAPYADHVAPIACVSGCSGTNRAADEIRSRTGAVCEAMEGAAVGLSALRIDPSILTGELRVISNTTGDRAAQHWDLDGALDRLGMILGRIAGELG